MATFCDKKFRNVEMIDRVWSIFVGDDRKETIKMENKYKTKICVDKVRMSNQAEIIHPICPLCQKHFVSKYTLEKHMHRIHQTSIDQSQTVELQQYRCRSMRCPFTTTYRAEQKKHVDKCVYILTDEFVQYSLSRQMADHQQEMQEMKEQMVQQFADHKEEIQRLKNDYRDDLEQLKDHYRQEIAEKDLEIRGLMSKLEVMEQMMVSRLQHADQLANRMADRSTTTNNTCNHIHHILADGKTYLEMTDHNRIKAIAHENKEKYFWQGQTGAANLVYEHVLCVPTNNENKQNETETGKKDENNEKRMLLVCTDASRKKCKYNNENNEVVEDIGAAHFLSKVAAPIVEAANEWHTTVTNQLKDGQRLKTIDALTVDGKTKQVDTAWLDIMDINDQEKNQRFVNKLCTLAKV